MSEPIKQLEALGYSFLIFKHDDGVTTECWDSDLLLFVLKYEITEKQAMDFAHIYKLGEVNGIVTGELRLKGKIRQLLELSNPYEIADIVVRLDRLENKEGRG